MNAWDYDLALGVHYSFEKALIANLQKYIADLQLLPEDFDMSVIKELVRKYRTAPDEPIHYAEHPTDELRGILTRVVGDCQDLSEYGICILANSEDMIIQQSIDDTIEETYQAMEAAIHNLNTLHCLPGSEQIWVSDKQQGKTRLITMKELDETFSPGRYEAFSINMDTEKTELKPIIASARKDNNRELVTVTNKMGAKVTVTTNHKMVTINKQTGKLYKAVPDEITTTIMPNVADDTYFAADITKREYRNSGDEYVYDISVKDNENFMTKACIFVSNSRAGSQVRLLMVPGVAVTL